MNEKVKEILLKQMELLQEVSKNTKGYEAERDLACMSSAMAELAGAYAKISTTTSTTD